MKSLILTVCGRLCLTLVISGVLCSPAAVLAEDITVSGSPNVGVLPTIIAAFTVHSDADVLPSGPTDYYVFTLFDTGAQRVYFDSSTATSLGVTNGLITDIRINGMGAIDPVTLYAPIYAGQAQAEVQGIPVALASGLDITLIGGPVTNVVKAVIDYTTTITRGPYEYLGNANVDGPDITFYPAQGSVGYTPAITLNLQAFGTIDDPGEGKRYWMYDVSFNEGAASVTSPASGDMNGSSTRFLYDTGTTVTLLREPLATALGLSGAAEFQVEVGGILLNGYYLDSITMTGMGGIYTVVGAPVLVTTSPLGGSADAIIGSNLFTQTQLLFDGPAATLGIGIAPAYQYEFAGFYEPVTNDAVNILNAGRVIPVKWRLMTLTGQVVTDPASFAGVFSSSVPCGGSALPADELEGYAGESGLQYLGDGYWQFNWKTKKAWTGTCREMYVKFIDGQVSPPVMFQFR